MKSAKYRKEYYGLSLISTILLALIPVITLATDDFDFTKYIVAAASAIASVLSSCMLLRRTKDNWVEYRITCEALKSERAKYRYTVGAYKTMPQDVRDQHFISTCEEILGAEHSAWSTRMRTEISQT